MRFKSIFIFTILGLVVLSGCSNVMSKADQQRALKSFAAKIEKDQQPVVNAERSLQNSLAQYNGSDTNYLNKSATTLKDASNIAESDFSTLSTPSGFPDDVDTLLNDEVNNLNLAYHSEYNGVESFLHYLDSQNPSDLQKYKDKLANAKQYKNQAISDLDQAKEKVGLK